MMPDPGTSNEMPDPSHPGSGKKGTANSGAGKPGLFPANIQTYLYLSALVLMACALPLSRALMSVAQGLLVFAWLTGGDLAGKFKRLKANPSVLIFASLFLVYVAGLAHSANTAIALNKIENMLAVLILPLVIGSSPELPRKHLKIVFLSFATAVVIASAISLIHLTVILDQEISNLNRPSLFMIPLRFSLLVNMAIFTLYGLAFRHHCGMAAAGEKIVYTALMAVLAVFLLLLGSMTGMVTLILLLIWTLSGEVKRSRNPALRMTAKIAAVVMVLGVFLYPSWVYRSSFHGRDILAGELDTATVNGNLYMHDTLTGVMENGHYVDLYLCETELRQAWNGISRLDFDGTDLKGQQLSYTLRRYLTSKGLRKDSLGLQMLLPKDIVAVENGITNARFLDASSFFQRLYGTLWEVHVYLRTGYVQNHSFSQRIVFSRLALKQAREHLFFGTGQGDVLEVMLQEAADEDVQLDENWHGSPHNQFLFLLLAFGLAGLGWTLFSWICSIAACRKKSTYHRDVFLIIAFLSMLVMDTLESYNSIVFFAFFYSLLVLSGTGKQQKHVSIP